MKEVKLSTAFTIIFLTRDDGEVERQVSYRELVKEALESALPGGLSIETMHPRLRVLEVLHKARNKDTVSFDDGDFELVHKLYKEMKFVIVNQGYEDFKNHLDEVAKSDEDTKPDKKDRD